MEESPTGLGVSAARGRLIVSGLWMIGLVGAIAALVVGYMNVWWLFYGVAHLAHVGGAARREARRMDTILRARLVLLSVGTTLAAVAAVAEIIGKHEGKTLRQIPLAWWGGSTGALLIVAGALVLSLLEDRRHRRAAAAEA